MSAVPAPVVEELPPADQWVNQGVDTFLPYMSKEKEQNWYKNINDASGRDLGIAQDKKGLYYRQHLDYGPGGRELAYLAGGLRKKLRMIPGTQTINDATAWLKATGKDKQGWKAHKADITGSDDYPDGYDEVFITDGKGRLKVVNGYALKQNDYPWRAAYYDSTTPEQRDNLPFSEWKRRATGIDYALDNGDYGYSMKLKGTAASVRPDITPRNYYRKAIFGPTYKIFKDEIDALQFNAMDKARLSTTIFKAVYENLIVKPTLVNDFGMDPERVKNTQPQVYKKLMSQKKVKNAINNTMLSYASNKDKLNQLFYLTAQQIITQLLAFADIRIAPEKPVFNTTAGELMKFGNQAELMRGIPGLTSLKGTAGKIKDWSNAVETGYQTAFKDKLNKRNANIKARNEAHDRWLATKLRQGTSDDRSRAAWINFTGQARPDGYNDFMYQEESPLDIPAPLEEITTEQKIEELEKNHKEIKGKIDLQTMIGMYIEEMPNMPLEYYGTQDFYNKFITWRLNEIKTNYNEIIKDGKIDLTPEQISRFRNLVLAYYSKNMNEFINIAEIESLIRFLKNQTRPNVRDVQSPEFKSAFYEYFINEAQENLMVDNLIFIFEDFSKGLIHIDTP